MIVAPVITHVSRLMLLVSFSIRAPWRSVSLRLSMQDPACGLPEVYFSRHLGE